MKIDVACESRNCKKVTSFTVPVFAVLGENKCGLKFGDPPLALLSP
jgi:hypothetical protein